MGRICGRCQSPVEGSMCPVCGFDCEGEIRSVALTAGVTLADRYVVGKVIGIGGFGITYLAYDTELERTVAVKEYYPRNTAIRSADNITLEPLTSLHAEEFSAGAERFRNEAELLAGLGDSDEVIKVYGTFEQNGTMYYVMEYVHGITVNKYISTHGRISEGQALYLARGVADAFVHIHSRNIIHRDLTPNNIMLTLDGKVKLVDFGNARAFFFNGGNSMTVSLKPGYAPLEQYQHHGNHGPWTDIYSLGMVMYHALTLDIPNDPMTRLDDDREFQKGLSGVNSRLAAVIKGMSAVRISDRYSTDEELLSALRTVNIKPQDFGVCGG